MTEPVVEQHDEESEMSDDIEDMIKQQQEVDKMNDEEFKKFENDLDLPDDTEEEDIDNEEPETDEELENYYRELGIEDEM
mmetsp:Transcript_6243/g.4432  ORF Transcript_6243/g.4432 Transcript_6243/m.4432 type:complete len:80 (+) Transcript_6243:275-514(+)|eukprot:CAMPEP_0116882192 /NCGR_PEP_ID=MMETSP0463-20121206/14377_1 /TAXON_ID=181622 /ORGANISM="Strombidinopsis sp, Strain SopsisLIS2011" /LENGTH=79 /DNA_ID=CAMNT_0004535037 /DNA_START=228 /DNA_END=467 /DNA_ORIENTATION=-